MNKASADKVKPLKHGNSSTLRKVTNMSRPLMCLAALLATCTSWAGRRDPVVYFDSMEGFITRTGIELRYRVSQRQTSFLYNTQDTPMLSFSVRNERTGLEDTYEAPLKYADEVEVPLGGWKGDTRIRVWVYSKFNRRYFMGFGNVVASSIEPRLALSPNDAYSWNQEQMTPPPGQGTFQGNIPEVNHWASQTDVIQACGQYFPFSDARSQCLQIANTAVTHPVAIIQACASRFPFASDSLDCLRKSTTTWYPPANAITACSRFGFRSHMTDCVGLLPSTRSDPSNVIDACRTSMYTGDSGVDCIRVALGEKRRR